MGLILRSGFVTAYGLLYQDMIYIIGRRMSAIAALLLGNDCNTGRNEQELQNAPTEQTRRSDNSSRSAGIARAGYVGDEFLPRRSGADGSASYSPSGRVVSPYRTASRPVGRARRRSS